MAELKKASLADICALVTDGTHDTPSKVEQGFPLVKAKEIVGGVIDFDTCDRISQEEHEKVIARSNPERGDTLFAHIGASLGEAAFINTDRPFSIKNVALFKPNPNRILGRYLYYLVISPAFQDLAKKSKTGSAQPFLSLGHLRGHRLQYHEDIEVQRRIASILSAYDELIENNNKRIKILEEMARMLYREWFVHFRFPGHEKVKMVDSALGKIPEGWEVVTLGDIVTEVRDSVKPGQLDPDTPYFGLEHLPRRSITLGTWGRLGDVQSTKLKARPDDILFGKIRPYFHKVGVCPIDCVCSSDTIIYRVKEERFFGLALSVTSSDDFVHNATATSQGTKMPRANPKVMKGYPVLLAAESVLTLFNSFVHNMVAELQVLSFKNRNLAQTRDLLLPKLISGEIDVDGLDIEGEV